VLVLEFAALKDKFVRITNVFVSLHSNNLATELVALMVNCVSTMLAKIVHYYNSAMEFVALLDNNAVSWKFVVL